MTIKLFPLVRLDSLMKRAILVLFILCSVKDVVAAVDNDEKRVALLKAIQGSDIEMVKKQTKRMSQFAINTDIQYGNTLLHKAIQHYAIIATTLAKPFDPNFNTGEEKKRIKTEERTKMEASKPLAFDIVKHLLDVGADVNARNNQGRSPMQIMNQYYGINTDIIKLLLDYGASLNARDKDGNTLLHLVAKHSDKDVDFTPLFALGADPKNTNNNGEAPLMLAIGSKSSKVIKIFLTHGADVTVADKHGVTALHIAAKYNNWRVVELLLDAGADLEAEDRRGSTALSYAAKNGKWNMVRRLLEKGANANISLSGSRQTVADLIISKPAIGLADMLDKNSFAADKAIRGDMPVGNNEFTAIKNASSNLNVNAAKKYLSLGADPNLSAGSHSVPLIEVSNYRWDDDPAWHLGLTDEQIEALEFNAVLQEYKDKAARSRQIFYLLLDYGADPDITNSGGDTALMIAAKAGNKEAVLALLKRGADINMRNRKNTTALIFALKSENWGVAELLIDNGADVLIPSYSRGKDMSTWSVGLLLGRYKHFLEGGETSREKSLQYIDKQRNETIKNTGPNETPSMKESVLAELYSLWATIKEKYNQLIRVFGNWLDAIANKWTSDKEKDNKIADIDYGLDEFRILLVKTLEAIPEDKSLNLDDRLVKMDYYQIFTIEGIPTEIKYAARKVKVRYKPDGLWVSFLRASMEKYKKRWQITDPDKLREGMRKIFPAAAIGEIKTSEEIRAEYQASRGTRATQSKQRVKHVTRVTKSVPDVVLQALADLPEEYRRDYLDRHDLTQADLELAVAARQKEQAISFPANCKLEHLLPKTEIYGFYVYRGKQLSKLSLDEKRQTYAVKVDINLVDEPIVLVLVGYEPIAWELSKETQTKLQGVILGGYHNQSIVRGAPNIPIVKAVYDDKQDCGFLDKKNANSFVKNVTGIDHMDLKEVRKPVELTLGKVDINVVH